MGYQTDNNTDQNETANFMVPADGAPSSLPGQVHQNPDGSRSLAIDPRYFSADQWEGKSPTVGIATNAGGWPSVLPDASSYGEGTAPATGAQYGQVHQNPDGSRSIAIDPRYYNTEQWEGKAPGVGIARDGVQSQQAESASPLVPAKGSMAEFDGNRAFTLQGTNDSDNASDALTEYLTTPQDPYHIANDPQAVAAGGTDNGKDVNNATATSAGQGQAGQDDAKYPPDQDAALSQDERDALWEQAENLSDKNKSVYVGTDLISNDGDDEISRMNFPNKIYDALVKRAIEHNSMPQEPDTSQDVFKNPGPIPGLSNSLQALVDKSYDLAKNPTALVNNSVTDRSRYYTQDGYRRMILRDLLAEMHGGDYNEITDDEARLVNPYFDPVLAKNGRWIGHIANFEANMLAGGAGEAAEMPVAVKTIMELVKEFSGK